MATMLDEWRVLPRLVMLLQLIVYVRCIEWFLSLEDPTTQQAGLISVVTGALSASYAIWMGKETK